MKISQAIDQIRAKIKRLEVISKDCSTSIACQKASAANIYISELNHLIETLLLDNEEDTLTFVSISRLATENSSYHPIEEQGMFYKLAYVHEQSRFLLYMVPISTL